ncbi:hypothetical protein TUM17561_14880 [Enterobacter cloacae]|nr:hypothetical protein TUM17561_14880 [Enterobacter cloacae]
MTAGLSRLAAVQQSREYFQQENVKWEDKGTGHTRGGVVKVFPVVFDLIARKMTRHILGRSLYGYRTAQQGLEQNMVRYHGES